MKASEAPEKIYLSDFTDTTESVFYVKQDNTKKTDFEYIRTDAFIEKAAKWIENNLSKYSELTDEDEYGNKLKEPKMNVFYGQAVKDFINYMKG